jgi:RHS repeat-associated protein
MKQLYLLLSLVLFNLLGSPIRVLGQCSTRPVGAGRYAAIDAGLLTSCRTSFTDAKNNNSSNCFGNFFESTQGGQPSDEIFYRFTLDTKQKVTISHCGSGFDTFLTLLDGSGNILAAANDTSKTNTGCGSGDVQEAFLRRSLPAGTYYVISEGYGTASGNITTQISVLPTQRHGAVMANAIDAGTLSSCGAFFSDTQRNDATSCFGNDYDAALNPTQLEGRPTDDIFYKFTLTGKTEVTLSHCSTAMAFNGKEADTYIHLLDSNGNRIASNDNNGPACANKRGSLRLTLEQGTYYVVSELYNPDNACNLITTISTSTAPAVGVTALSTTLSTGGSTTLTASGANTYSWSPATGLSATTGTSVTAAPARTTTYTVTGTATGTSASNCNQAVASITIVVNSVPTAQSDPAQDLDLNWTFSRTYDLDGNITGEAKQFADGLGRPTQSQTKNIAAKQVFASQVVNNAGGKAVLSTLPAPTFNQEFKYRKDFMNNVSGTSYSAIDFEGPNVNNATRLDSTVQGTLGYYYSQNNLWEPAIAATRNPYSLTELMPGPLGGVRRAAGPGDKFRMGAGHESKGRSFPLLNELDQYSSLRPQFLPGSVRAQGVKSVSVNTNGMESISFANRESQVLASCLSGDQYPATILTGTLNIDPTNAAASPIYQDIHIGASTSPTTVTVTNTVGTPSSFVVVDLLSTTATETVYSGSQTLTLAPGFYRLRATSGQFSFSYPVHYGNFSYSYYDDAGRLIATVAPNGLPGNNFLRNPDFEQDAAGGSSISGWLNMPGGYTQPGTGTFPRSHGGQFYGVHWAPQGHYTYTYQVLTGLPNGLYTARAWVKNTGITSNYPTQVAELLVKEYSTTGAQKAATIPVTSASGNWVQVQVTDIPVTNGQCTVGLWSISPKDDWIIFDDVEFIRQAADVSPTFVTRNLYDTAGRLLQTNSPDEGTTQYVYARDGRIRFSQSARQLTEGKFSYSNYDAAGRAVESGEYQMASDRTKGVVFESPYAISSRVYEAERDAQLRNVRVGNGVVDNLIVQGNSSTTASSVTFSLNSPTTETYALDVRYSAAGTSLRTLSVYVNGSFSQQASFPGTNDWNVWNTQTIMVPLQSGPNTVELRYGPNDNGWLNLDYVQLQYNKASSTANSILNETILEDRTRTGGLEVARCSQRNQVWYDLPFQDAALNGRTQDFVFGGAAKTSKDGATTWYSYNDLGQLTWMVQEQPVIGTKTLDYSYDAAGNVLTIAYQKNQSDAFYHHYTYDANQRLTQAYTSLDGTAKTLQAAYYYYLHGPLKRVELAGNLQGLDYTYTVQGWLKSINNSQRSLDPGKDGPIASGMFKDLFGMRLDYFDNDYRSRQVAALNPTVSLNQNRQRFDGTVRAASWRTAGNPNDNANANTQAYGMGYLYDAKGQLLEANFATVTNGTAFTFSPNRTNGEDNLSYDANGNIGSLRRLNAAGAATDNFTYQYVPGTNKLAAVNNPTGTAVLDYDYDATGQMTRQRDEQGQRYLRYDVTGKVTGVFRDQARMQPLATFTYDDRGFRASKATYNATGQLLRITFSVRDQQGNEVSTYVQEGYGAVQRTEVPVYGASRLGTLTRLDDGSVDPRYELNDHLGNARVVFHKPTTDSGTETMEGDVPAKYAFQGANLYYAAPASRGHNNSTYVAELDGSASPKSLQRVVTVQKGDTITFTAWAKAPGNFAHPNVAPSPGQVQPFLLLGATGLSDAPRVPIEIGRQASIQPSSNRWPGRIAVGLSISLGTHRQTKTSSSVMQLNGTQQTLGNYNAWIQYQVKDANGSNVGQPVKAYLTGNAGDWQQLRLGVRVEQGGSVELTATSADATSYIFFDDLTVEQAGGMIVQEQHTYAYGAPLTDLNYVIGTKKYRHGYQGQYAEKDEETGWDDFELRMYDSRIGRWMAPDPMGQFYSPYVGMSNNPVLNIDPDGGFSVLGNGYSAVAASHSMLGSIATFAGIGAANLTTRLSSQGLGNGKNPPSQPKPPIVNKKTAAISPGYPGFIVTWEPIKIPPIRFPGLSGLVAEEALLVVAARVVPILAVITIPGDTRQEQEYYLPMYRNVGEDEYQSYLRKGFNFGVGYGNYEGKLFWATPPPAVWLNSRFAGPYTIQILVPKSVIGPHKLVQGHLFYEDGTPYAGYSVQPGNINGFNAAKRHVNIQRR